MSETLQAKDQSNALRCEATHSPLPWTVDWSTGRTEDSTQLIIGNVDGFSRANFNYIVKACNEYPKLIEALKNLHACHRTFSSNDNWTALDDDARSEAEDVLERCGA